MTIYISIVEILLKKPDLKHYAYEDHDYTYFRENDEFISYHFLKKSLNAIFSGAADRNRTGDILSHSQTL